MVEIPPVFWKRFEIRTAESGLLFVPRAPLTENEVVLTKSTRAAGSIFRSVFTDNTLKLDEGKLQAGINAIVDYNKANFPPRVYVKVMEKGNQIGAMWFDLPTFLPPEGEIESLKNDEAWPEYVDSVFDTKVDPTTGIPVDQTSDPTSRSLYPSALQDQISLQDRPIPRYLLATPDFSFVIPDRCDHDGGWSSQPPDALHKGIERSIYELSYPTIDRREYVSIMSSFNLYRKVPTVTKTSIHGSRNTRNRRQSFQFGDWVLGLTTMLAAGSHPCVNIMSKASPEKQYGSITVDVAGQQAEGGFRRGLDSFQVVQTQWPVAGDLNWRQSHYKQNAAQNIWRSYYSDWRGGLSQQPAVAVNNKEGQCPGQYWKYSWDVILHQPGLSQAEVGAGFMKAAAEDGKTSYDLIRSGETLGTIHIRYNG